MEDKDFINKEYPQNCGDTLKVFRKTTQKNSGGYWLYECEFQKYPYKHLYSKKEVLKGTINNPQIEKIEFIDKIWLQKCGDSLKIIEKIRQNNKTLFECEFIKYPYKVFVTKAEILKGSVLNPQIEQVEFVNKIWPQKCGDSLRIIKKTNEKQNGHYLWECEFTKYPCTILASKANIIQGKLLNKNYPHRNKESLISFIRENFKDEKLTLEELSNKLNISYSYTSELICKYKLFSYISYSKNNFEESIRNYVKSLYINVSDKEVTIKDNNSNKQYGIDIYIPYFKLGIEANGSYWHSELYKSPNYHQEKSLIAKEQGIQLIHIFSYEWQDSNKQNILKSLIKLKLGIFDKKIPARKCIIKEISINIYRDFCEKNHLQGKADARIKLGLFYQEELIQIMSFSCPRFTDKYEYEIIRECSKQGYIILGGKEKLWSYFVKNYNPKDCISYCDFSKFTGNSYLKLGFKKERLNKPGFWWLDRSNDVVFLRSPEKNQEMKEKYIKIYDAGQLVFVWNN